VKVSSAFSRVRISRILVIILFLPLLQITSIEIGNAAPACVLNTDYTKDTSSVANYTILKFTKSGSCSYRNIDSITSFEYLIVGGGGGGGAHVGGGGGGGGVLQGTSSVSGLGAFPITVGAGGTGAWATQSGWTTTGSNGGNSTLNNLVAFGGGVGGIWNTYAPGYVNGSVGSAGGSGHAGDYGGGTTGQGKGGGTGHNVQPHAAGGGGGAGQVGGNGTQVSSGNGTGGKGGDGLSISITGTSTYYGGGGGGGVHGNNNEGVYTGGAGGLGGGGAGSSHSGSYYVTPRQPANYGTSGTANTGGGGGGAGGGWTWVENKAGNGGSGIIVIKYLSSSTLANEVDNAVSFSSTNHYGYTSIAGADAIQPSSSEAFTVAAWVRPAYTCSTRCAIYSREGQMRLSIYAGKIAFILYNTNAWNSWTDLAIGDVPANQWSHVALTRSGTTIKVFLNGSQIASYTQTYAPLANNTSYTTYVGTIHGASEPFVGAIDEVKVWKTDRSSNIATDMNSSDELSTGLAAYWNFNEGSGSTSYNLAPGVISETELTISNSALWNSAVVSDVTTSGPYTVRTFYRTYLTGNDGWKTPSGISALSTVVVAGGGGGGAESDDTGWMGGGGGAGGYQFSNISVSANSEFVTVKIGMGGRAGQQVSGSAAVINQPTNGIDSQFKSLVSIGGGAGGISFTNANTNGVAGGSGGGGATYSGSGGAGTSGQGNSGGSTTTCCAGGGGGGAGSAGGNGAPGSNVSQSVGGAAGDGVINPLYISGVSAQYLAAGGAGLGYTTAGSAGSKGGTAVFTSASANTGSGGGGGGSSATQPDKVGGAGGSGIVIVRYITASKPIFTYPTNAYLNVGMTETFTTNVAADSATAVLTRTFRWESSTAGAGGPFTVIKTGTGASNAAFSWIPTDTSTSGSNFLYRVVVTDSDTAGLFIQDTSTAVFAVINRTLLMSGSSTMNKTINVARSETYTISQGTPTYRYSLSPVISGITLDTSTVGTAILKIADTATVGTFIETLTVTDSVTGTVVIPMTITVSAPPSLTAGGEIVANGQVLNLDAGNSQSILLGDSAVATSRVWNDLSGNQKNATTSTTVNSTTCNPPRYSTSNGGILTFNSAGSTCYATPYLGSQFAKSYTIETWFKLNSATLPAGTQILSQQYNTNGENLSFTIGDCGQNDGKIRVGFFDGGAWRYAWGSTNGYTPVQNAWVHIAGTYDGISLRTYINGTLFSETAFTGGVGALNTKGILIGKRWDSTYYIDGSIGEVRAYNRALTSTEIAQNYNSTKYRYLSSNVDFVKPSQKYGSLNLESFTVSAGGDIKTVSFQVGSRTGITWDTATAGVVNLSVLSSLPVGTYYDTVTVTDNFSSATSLPIKFTVTKADTITVTTTLSSNSVTYNESPANVTVTHTATGLVNSETLTATSSYTTTTCEYGGTCSIGDIAPGGGYVFHVSATPINVATGISTGGIYLATAPRTWGGTAADPTATWGCSGTNVSGTNSAVGSGAENTRLINAACATTGIASRLAADSSAEGFTDWFVPSIGELNLMRSNLKVNSLSNLDGAEYWSSMQAVTTGTLYAQYQWFTGGTSGPTDKNNNLSVRPIRAFSPTALASNSIPTDAGTYRVGGSYSLSAPASLSNYLGIESVTATLTINKARQTALSIGQYESYPNISSFPINVYGGSGPGLLSRTLVSAGSANCTLGSNAIITATNIGTCTVKAEKAGTRNYFLESTTAVVTWITWSTNYATQSPGGNHAIPLNGGNQIIVRTETVTASAFSNETGTAISSGRVGTKLRINSTGFSGLSPSALTVTFRPYEDAVINAVTSTYVEVVIPSGAVTGVIAIDSPRGVAYTQSFTISP